MEASLDLLTDVQRREILEVLDWLASYRDIDEVSALMRRDALIRKVDDGLSFLTPAAWTLLAEIALESILLPVAIQVKEGYS